MDCGVGAAVWAGGGAACASLRPPGGVRASSWAVPQVATQCSWFFDCACRNATWLSWHTTRINSASFFMGGSLRVEYTGGRSDRRAPEWAPNEQRRFFPGTGWALSPRLSARFGLAGFAFHPAIGHHRILPKVLFRDNRALAGEVVANYAQYLRVGSPLVAVRPVAAIEDTVLAEGPKNLIQTRAVEIQVFRNTPINAAQDLGNLNVYLRPLANFPQVGPVRIASRPAGRRIQLRQMVNHHAQTRHFVGDPHHGVDQGHVGICGIQT